MFHGGIICQNLTFSRTRGVEDGITEGNNELVNRAFSNFPVMLLQHTSSSTCRSTSSCLTYARNFTLCNLTLQRKTSHSIPGGSCLCCKP